MKQLRLFLLLAAGLFLTSCSEPQPEEFPNPDPPPTVGRHAVPIDQALGELDNLLGVIDGQGTRAGGVRTVAQVQTLHAQALPLTRSAGEPGEQPDELLYVVNFEDDAGYAVLGADDRLPAVLAVTDEGSLTTEELVRASNGQDETANSLPDRYMMNYVNGMVGGGFVDSLYLNHGLGDNQPVIVPPLQIRPIGSFYGAWDSLEYVAPLTRTKWGQRDPFNAYCPTIGGEKCVTGCVSVATAQVLCSNMFRFGAGPQRVAGDYDIDWPAIFRTIYKPSLIRNSTTKPITQEALAVAYLIRGCGRGCGMNIGDYGLTESKAGKRKAISFFEDHGYKGVTWHTFREKYVRTMIWERKRAVYVRGEGNGGKSKHAWVADGWLYRRRFRYNLYPNNETHVSYTERQLFMHCNFGWRGDKDGYYYIGIFDTQNGPQLQEPGDHVPYGSAGVYDDNLKIITYTEVY